MKRFLSSIKHKILLIIRVLFSNDAPYIKWHYAQEGEDCIIWEILRDKKTGFYVDVGAHHPFGYSNTWIFYKKGWRGINLDAMPGSMTLFKKYRPRDINLEIPVAGEQQRMQFYIFKEPALNGFLSQEGLNKYISAGYSPLKTHEFDTKGLAEILDKHLPVNTSITFMSIDVEGLELQVLQSNNWEKYRPELLIVEIPVQDFEQVADHPVTKFLSKLNYRPVAKSTRNVFFKSSD